MVLSKSEKDNKKILLQSFCVDPALNVHLIAVGDRNQ